MHENENILNKQFDNERKKKTTKANRTKKTEKNRNFENQTTIARFTSTTNSKKNYRNCKIYINIS